MAEPWAATITADGSDLRIRFVRPVSEITLTRDAARELATSLLLAAEGRQAAESRQPTRDELRQIQARVAEIEGQLGQQLDPQEYERLAEELHDSCSRLRCLEAENG